jgi:diguanylate cyclase (GGDEF)-like protein
MRPYLLEIKLYILIIALMGTTYFTGVGWWSAVSLILTFTIIYWIMKPLRELSQLAQEVRGMHSLPEVEKPRELLSISKTFADLSEELTRQRNALAAFSQLATLDGMTGLANFSAFKGEFKKMINVSQRHERTIGLVLMDIDHFKKINDQYGHSQGDQVLRTLAKALLSVNRNTDFVARYGGEEFALLLQQADVASGVAVAERVRQTIESTKFEDLERPGSYIPVTVSIGLLIIDGKKLLPKNKFFDISNFIVQADKNLYQAKRDGRNRVVTTEWEPTATPE